MAGGGMRFRRPRQGLVVAALALAAAAAGPAANAGPRDTTLPPGFATYPLAATRGVGVPQHELWLSTRVDNPPAQPVFAWQVDAPSGYPACDTFTQEDDQVFKGSGTTTYASRIHVEIGTAAGCPPDGTEGGSDSFDGHVAVTIVMGTLTCTVGTTGPLDGSCTTTGAAPQPSSTTSTTERQQPASMRRAAKLVSALKKLDTRLAWLQKRLAAGKRVSGQTFVNITLAVLSTPDYRAAAALPPGWSSAFGHLDSALQSIRGTDLRMSGPTDSEELRRAAAALGAVSGSADARAAAAMLRRIAGQLDAAVATDAYGKAETTAGHTLLRLAGRSFPPLGGLRADAVLKALIEVHNQYNRLNPVGSGALRGKERAVPIERMRSALDRIRKAAEKAARAPAP